MWWILVEVFFTYLNSFNSVQTAFFHIIKPDISIEHLIPTTKNHKNWFHSTEKPERFPHFWVNFANPRLFPMFSNRMGDIGLRGQIMTTEWLYWSLRPHLLPSFTFDYHFHQLPIFFLTPSDASQLAVSGVSNQVRSPHIPFHSTPS